LVNETIFVEVCMKFLLLVLSLLSVDVYAKEYIVFYKPGVVGAATTNKRRLKHFPASVIELTDSQYRVLKAKGVRLEPNGKVHMLGHKSAAVVKKLGDKPILVGNLPWGVDAVHSRTVNLKNNVWGKGKHICLVDTGVDYTHPDLAGQVTGGSNFVSSPVDKTKQVYFDDNGHGTHVAGTMVGLGIPGGVIGVAPKSKVYAVKVLDKDGNGDYAAVADGLIDCIAHAKVVNMSLGGAEDSGIMHDAVNKVLKSGLIIVAAAGNDGNKNIEYPAAYAGVHAVSAMDINQKFATFSDFGPKISFVAPGVAITSTVPGGGYESWEGTSMASPHMSGVVALMLSANGKKAFGTKVPTLTGDQQGRGLIDAVLTVK